MSQIRITRPALDEVEQALKKYEALLTKLVAEEEFKESTRDTYFDRAERFVRWLRGEYDPGAGKND